MLVWKQMTLQTSLSLILYARSECPKDYLEHTESREALTTFSISVNHAVGHDKSTSGWARRNNGRLGHFALFNGACRNTSTSLLSSTPSPVPVLFFQCFGTVDWLMGKVSGMKKILDHQSLRVFVEGLWETQPNLK